LEIYLHILTLIAASVVTGAIAASFVAVFANVSKEIRRRLISQIFSRSMSKLRIAYLAQIDSVSQ
jgi:hypothetical protein